MDWARRERHPSLQQGEAPQCSLLGLSWGQLVVPCFPPPGLDREGAMCSRQTRIWRHPARLQGKPKGMVKPRRLKGWIKPPRCPRSRPVLSAPRLTRILLRQGPVPHLSKPEVSRLADWSAALGFGVKLLTYLERFPNDSLWGRVWMGEIR